VLRKKIMRKFFSLFIALAVVAGVQFVTTDAEAKCGCVKTWNKCLKKANRSNKPKPGKAAKAFAARQKDRRACDANFRKCTRKCGAKCVAECRAMKKAKVKSCRADFKDSLCPVKGKDHRECLKAAKKARNACVKDAKNDNCKKTCKK